MEMLELKKNTVTEKYNKWNKKLCGWLNNRMEEIKERVKETFLEMEILHILLWLYNTVKYQASINWTLEIHSFHCVENNFKMKQK